MSPSYEPGTQRHEPQPSLGSVTVISFNINTMVSRLSWEVADRKISFAEAERQFERLSGDTQNAGSFCCSSPSPTPRSAVSLAATLCYGNRRGCHAAGLYLKQLLLRARSRRALVFLVCSFHLLDSRSHRQPFSIGTTPEIAIGHERALPRARHTFLNSFSDMLYRHTSAPTAALPRGRPDRVDLSTGLCAGMSLMHVGMF